MTQPLARSPGGLDLSYLALQAGRLVQNAVDEAAAEAGIPPMDLLALYLLGRHDGLTGGALARLLCVQQSSVTPLADRLEAGGLIERARDATDRRRVWLCPTTRGEEVLRAAADVGRVAVRQVFASLSPGSAAALAALLGEVVEPWLADVLRPRALTKGGPAQHHGVAPAGPAVLQG